MSCPWLLRDTESVWAQFPHMHSKGIKNKMSISKCIWLWTVTPVIGSHSAEVWKSRPLKVSPRSRCGPRKPACQEQSRLLGPLQCKDTPTGQEGPRGSKGALKSWWCQLSFLSTTPTLRTSPGTFQTLTLQTLLSCREFYLIQTSLGVKRSPTAN